MFQVERRALPQVWFDDPRSLALRYSAAQRLGLRGVGFWNTECLYQPEDADHPREAAADADTMWRTVAAALQPDTAATL